jgi:putative hydrolase of the HAD superfamily
LGIRQVYLYEDRFSQARIIASSSRHLPDPSADLSRSEKNPDELRSGYLLGIISDAQPCYALPEIGAAGLEGYFDPVIISASRGYRKPDPRLWGEAIQVMNLNPSQAIYVGDDMYRDIFGAQRVGIRTIFVDSNQGAKSYENITPDFFAARFEQVMEGIVSADAVH